MAIRCARNPLITTNMVRPSKQGLKVIGVFNPGAVQLPSGETLLLMRVAENYPTTDEDLLLIPVANREDPLEYRISEQSDTLNFSDSRAVTSRATGKVVQLTSLSHIRVARSMDGENFTIDDEPLIVPTIDEEVWGIEDPRVVYIPEMKKYVITYTAVSSWGVATAMATTTDFKTVERHGLIFPVENKDVSILPERVGGYFFAYHRPVPKSFGNPDIWSARSPDLIHWGQHRHVMGVDASDKDAWTSNRVGGGAPSVRTARGWLHIYHAADKGYRYCLGAFLAAHDEPWKITACSTRPILEPDEVYEREGFFPNVVFTCGVLLDGEPQAAGTDDSDAILRIYYGAADDKIALCRFRLGDIYATLRNC